MKSLSPTEAKALAKIESLYQLNGKNEVSRQQVTDLVNEIWKLPVEKNSLIGALICTLNDCLKLARSRNDFFALAGYDLDMVVRHYQMVAIREEEEW